jgi:DNA repair protein RecO (recombination protein O)
MLLHKTEGIVLRIVRYGETSVIAHVLTELFGVQSYMVNGVRGSRTSGARASLLQPANILDMVVYHRDGDHLQRISDIRFSYLYRSLYADMVKNAVALYLVELLDKALRQPEPHAELFYLAREALQWMDGAGAGIGNLPLYFTLRLSEMLGFRFYRHACAATPYLDLREGSFVGEVPPHGQYLDETCGLVTDALLRVPGFAGLGDVKTDKHTRQRLLAAYQEYYRLHLPGFTGLRSPGILAEVLD